MNQSLLNEFIPTISLDDYSYSLPEERIAKFPLPERDQSKLLVANASGGTIAHHTFRDIPSLLPSDAILIRNNTKVILARLFLQKPSGGKVEVFCVEPHTPHEQSLALSTTRTSTWTCLIGGRKILAGMKLGCVVMHGNEPLYLNAQILSKSGSEAVVAFSWSPENLSFAAVLEAVGKIPLPPYLKRDAEESDKARYQTVYARHDGSVAAPTAGLHFTPPVLSELEKRGIATAEVTLHVGMGTFKPVESQTIQEHAMHTEQVVIPLATLHTIRERLAKNEHAPLIAVGTTSLRTMESAYWFGARLFLSDGEANGKNFLWVSQWDSYRLRASHRLPSALQSIDALLAWAERHHLEAITGETQMIIVPGYDYKFCTGLITNFHQPNSTLILLVAAFLGKALWRRVYEEALKTDYRFLSYGDSSLLLR
jgi:S-adenosylmethionine:tRNA ribosyltransferase-isomerase